MKHFIVFVVVYIISVILFIVVGIDELKGIAALVLSVLTGIFLLFHHLRDIELNQKKIMEKLGMGEEAEKPEMDVKSPKKEES